MRFLTVFAILALAIATSEGSVLSRLFWTISAPTTKAPLTTTRATTTTARPTTRPTTTTTAAAAEFEKGELPPDTMDRVLAIIDQYPELQEREHDIFSRGGAPDPDPLMQQMGTLPIEMQNIFKCIKHFIDVHVAGTDISLSDEVPCSLSVPVVY